MSDFTPLMRRLGYSSADRLAVLHADDVGMCEASVSAYRQISARGILSSAAAMVPCGWFPAVAALCRKSPTRDVGVHLTLTSEWTDYRWGPLLGPQVPELRDGAGYFFPLARDVQHDSTRDAVHRELRAQLLRAQQLGVDVTHIDSHMFTLLHPTLFPVYAALSREFQVPCVVRPGSADGLLEHVEAEYRESLPALDCWAQLPLTEHEDRLDRAERILDSLPSGVSYLISHPAVDTPELRAIAPDWRARVADYHLYLDDKWAQAVERSGVKVVGMRSIRDALFERV